MTIAAARMATAVTTTVTAVISSDARTIGAGERWVRE
jgi:hypothetical protein